MFDLNKEIADWRRELMAAGIKTTARLEELESHLREDVEQQVQTGADARQAFESAIQRIGPVHLLKKEFTKVDSAKLTWGRKTARRAAAFHGMVYLLIGVFVLLRTEMALSERMWGFAAVAFGVLCLFAVRFVRRFLPVIANKRTRMTVRIVCLLAVVAWAIIFCQIVLPGFDFTLNQILVGVSLGADTAADHRGHQYGIGRSRQPARHNG